MLNYYSWWVGGWEKTKLMLYSTLVEIEVEVGVELGKMVSQIPISFQTSYRSRNRIAVTSLADKNKRT